MSVIDNINRRYGGVVVGIKENNQRKITPAQFLRAYSFENGILVEVSTGISNGVVFRNQESIPLERVVFDPPRSGFVNYVKKKPMYCGYLSRIPARQYRGGLNPTSHGLSHLPYNYFQRLNKITPRLTFEKPWVCYPIYGRIYFPWNLAWEYVMRAKALSLAVSRRFALFAFDNKYPLICYNGKFNVGRATNNKIEILDQYAFLSEELSELSGREVIPFEQRSNTF